MIAEGDAAKATLLQAAHVHQLGDLTLSGYNAELATASFEKKQTLAKDKTVLGHKIDIGYGNHLWLNDLPFGIDGKNETLANAQTWTADMINARTSVMVDLLIDAMKLPGETTHQETTSPLALVS